MQKLTRRTLVLKAATGLATAAALPAAAMPTTLGAPFRIARTERFLEIRRLQAEMAKADAADDRTAFATAWNRIMFLQGQIPQPPRTPEELLEYATIAFHWNSAIADGDLDPCEALMRQRKYRNESYRPEQTAIDLLMAVFSLAGYRATSHERWVHIRWDPPEVFNSSTSSDKSEENDMAELGDEIEEDLT
jgi:hypothetical protein